jgi:hypothetical protein
MPTHSFLSRHVCIDFICNLCIISSGSSGLPGDHRVKLKILPQGWMEPRTTDHPNAHPSLS